MIKYLTGFSVIFLLLSLSVSFTGDTLTAFAQQDSDSGLQGTVQIGVLVPLTGDESFAGDEIVQVINYAESNFNAYLSGIGADWVIELVVRDVMLDPAAALEHTMSFDEMGINTIVGPYTSAQITAMKPYTDSNDMLVISYGSTAPSLAIPDDSVLRFIPNDNSLAPIIAKYFADSGITHVVPVWRGDVWGEGLADVSRAEFEAIGGIMDEGIRYNPADPNFDDVTATLSDKVNTLVGEVGADKVAVLVIVFGEITDLINSAAAHDNLDDVLWVGSAFAQSKDVAEDEISSQFLEDSNMAAIDFTVASTPITQDVRDTVNDVLGRDPSSYALSAYDVVQVLGLSMASADSTDAGLIRQAIPSVLEDYSGTLGSIVLNDAGDLANSFYELWGIEDGTWILNAVYDPTSDSITRHDVMSDDDKMMMDDDKMMMSDIPKVVQVGVIIPATGDIAAHGQDNSIGVQLGLTDFNNYLEEIGATWRMSLVLEDTQTDPIIALEKLQSLNSKGIKFILGPETSAELRNIKSYADSNDMVLISPSSTSPALAIDDNIFRLIPDDTQQGVVLAKLFEEQGIRAVIPVYRGDVWGDGLFESTKMNFEALGGVMDDGLRYSPDVTVYSTEANLLSNLVDRYTAEYSVDEVAVMLISFSEAVHILNFADSYDNLREVRWFGSDASSHDSTLSGDPISSVFTEDVNFVSTQFATSTNDIYAHVRDYFIDFKGSTPNAYAYSSYDSVWVLGKTIIETNSADPITVRDAIIDVAATHTGAIGTVNLNQAGDLAISNYDLWSINDGVWNLYGHYDAGTGVFDYVSDSMMMMDKSVITATDDNVVQIGVLAQITGDTSETGAEVTIISQYAESKFNEYLDSIGADWTIQAVIEDIGDDPTTAASVVARFDKMGITTVVGPYSSAQTLSVKSYTDYNDMLAISYGSTAPSLAIPYDSIMRFVPDDTNLGPIFAQYLIDSGVTHVVPVWRGDVWGDGLTDITRTEFEALGGTMDEGIRYDPTSVDFDSVTSELSDKVATFVDETSVDNVAVLALSFDEILDLLTLAATHDNLDDVIWTGTPYAKSNKILTSDAANSFAENVYLTAIDSAAESNDLTSEVNDVISEALSREPVSYALAAYDAIWVYGLAIEAVGSNDVTLIAAEIPSVLEDYSGVLGPITLNEAGDMDNGFYELWRVQDDRWVLYAVYDPIVHSIVMKDDKMMMMDDKGDVAEDIDSVIDDGGGCLIATAAYGSELAPQVQLLREIRSDTLMSSSVGSSFMTEFNLFYYTLSPPVADLQRNNVIFGDTVRTVITPGIYTLGAIMGLADSNEESVLAFGVLSIVALIGLYIAGPVFAVFGARRLVRKIQSGYQGNQLSEIEN